MDGIGACTELHRRENYDSREEKDREVEVRRGSPLC